MVLKTNSVTDTIWTMNAMAGFLLLFLQDILIFLVASFFLSFYAEYIVYQPFFAKPNHQQRTKKTISLSSTNIISNIFSCSRKSMFTKIKSIRPCIRLAELNLGKHRIWVNTSFSHFFLSFERYYPPELEGRTPQQKKKPSSEWACWISRYFPGRESLLTFTDEKFLELHQGAVC